METLLELRKFVAPEFVFGPGARHLVGRYVRNLGGTRPLLVTDPGVTAAGWAGEVAAELHEAGTPAVVFDAVSANPRDAEVAAGATLCREAGCDLIIAVGGGSPIDCAKGIGICVANDEPIGAFEGVDVVAEPGPPLICIPTTSGSAADVSQFAIIASRVERRKYAIISKSLVPDVSLIDPETTVTMDPYLTACTGVDALTHALEAYVSTARSVFTDSHALAAVAAIRESLPAALADPGNLGARAGMMRACTDAGLAFSNASLGAAHAMAHSLGGLLDLAHGECNALVLPQVTAFNFPAASDRYLSVAEALGRDVARRSTGYAGADLTEWLAGFIRSLGIAARLGNRGVVRADIGDLARNALRDPCLVTNPRRPGMSEMEALFEQAL